MATAIFDFPMSSLPTSSSQQTRPVLRRATYVHVSDLTSAYNIDHARLEQELTRVKVERVAASVPTKTPDLGEGEDEAAGAVSDLDASSTSGQQKRLQPPRGGYNLCVLVGGVTVVVDKRRVDRSRVRLAEVEIGDETGTVSLRARDEQIDVLEEVSKRNGAVVLRNCTLELYQGKHIRLAVTKWGKLSVYPDNVASTPPPPSKMNFDRNFSLIDLSVVASEMVETHPETTYSMRPTKPESPDTTGRASTPKSGTQSHPKHHQSQSAGRRGSRDRRQPRGKQSGTSTGGQHYSSTPGEMKSMQQQQPGQIRYHGMHPYPAYSYPHGGQQEQVLSTASAQQIMLQRQYELQQRQLQHMYGQQERHRSGMSQGHHVQAAGMMLQPVIPSGSFEGSTEYPVQSYPTGGSEQHHSVMSVVGSTPVLIPMTMTGSRGPGGVSSTAREQFASRSVIRGSHQTGKVESAQIDVHESTSSGQRGRDSQNPYMNVSAEEQFSPGRMNPDATAFAPSYMASQAMSSAAHQIYFPYDPSQAQGGSPYQTPSHHQALYSQAMMYVPASQASKTPSPAGGVSTNAPRSGSGNVSNEPKRSGKENLKSPP